jgi:hypothetical protein
MIVLITVVVRERRIESSFFELSGLQGQSREKGRWDAGG